MTFPASIANLTKAVNEITAETNVPKSTLDAKVAQAEAETPLAQAQQALAEGYRDEAATHAADAATHLATVQAGVTYQGIEAILAEKAVTAVDVFIYDTSLDSDGGAWRKRCQHTSWYNETLNTATRGSRREFPAVAVIVAESNKVTIYDGDDPSLPMWMVFNAANGPYATGWWENAPAKSVYAINGVFSVALDGSVTETGLLIANFVSGTRERRTNNASYGGYGQTLVSGGDTVGLPNRWLSTDVIVNGYCNDVAMTVLPDAPVDPATGLPVPTIAVGTSGGTSVIKDNGEVVDILNWSTNRTMRVAFDKQSRLFIHDAHPSVSGYGAVVQFNRLPGGDVTTLFNSHADGDVLYDVNYNGWNLPRSFDSNHLGFRAISCGGSELALGSYSTGLTRLKYAEDGDGLAAFHGSDHAPYYAPRDTRGVFLAETDTASLAATVELNEDADMLDSSLWSYSADGVDWSVPGQVTITEQNGSDRSLSRNIPSVVVGKYYRIEIEYTNATTSASGNRIYFAGGTYYVLSATSEPTTTVFYAKARSGQNLGILLSETNATTTVLRMSVKEVDFDRHRNPTGADGGPAGLIVNGTITRSPVADGAELVAYSGFSTTANFLEQLYNGALDFGTGDFSIMVWLDRMEAWRSVVSRGMTGAVSFIIEGNGTENTMRISTGNTPRVRAMPWFNGVWRQLTFVRRSGVAALYLDGVQTDSWSAPENVSVPDAPLFVGKNTIFGSGFYTGKMALLRISATAPTPDQIAKIYEDERKLFQPGAQCTLYGTSDAVTALAHDPKTNLLHVGTSAGRSTFDGLVRVANTTTPVGTAISAVNGLIVEE